MSLKSYSSEMGLYLLALIFLAFSYTNFRPEVANGLFILTVISIVAFQFDYSFLDKKLSIPFISPSMKWGKAILIGTAYAFVFVLLSSVIVKLPFLATAKLITQATMPTFGKSLVMVLITWVIVVGFVESMTAVRIYEFWANRFKINPLQIKKVSLIIIGVIGVGTLLFHSTAYGITNNKALFLSFLFFTSGIIVSIKYKEARPFVIGHQVVNGLAFSS